MLVKEENELVVGRFLQKKYNRANMSKNKLRSADPLHLLYNPRIQPHGNTRIN